MFNGLRLKLSRGTLLCTAAILIAAPVVTAQIITGPRICFTFYGVDEDGNLTQELGGPGFGRYFKFSRSGVIIGFGRARVTNESGGRATFRNLGLPVIDPETDEELVTTYDIYDVRRRPGFQRARVRAAGIYIPGGVEN